jgi:hypothetical protein
MKVLAMALDGQLDPERDHIFSVYFGKYFLDGREA